MSNNKMLPLRVETPQAIIKELPAKTGIFQENPAITAFVPGCLASLKIPEKIY